MEKYDKIFAGCKECCVERSLVLVQGEHYSAELYTPCFIAGVIVVTGKQGSPDSQLTSAKHFSMAPLSACALFILIP